jgi:hypothetical protein
MSVSDVKMKMTVVTICPLFVTGPLTAVVFLGRFFGVSIISYLRTVVSLSLQDRLEPCARYSC